jgi:hypothetical protein
VKILTTGACLGRRRSGPARGLERKRTLLELVQLTLGPAAHEALVTVGG